MDTIKSNAIALQALADALAARVNSTEIANADAALRFVQDWTAAVASMVPTAVPVPMTRTVRETMIVSIGPQGRVSDFRCTAHGRRGCYECAKA